MSHYLNGSAVTVFKDESHEEIWYQGYIAGMNIPDKDPGTLVILTISGHLREQRFDLVKVDIPAHTIPALESMAAWDLKARKLLAKHMLEASDEV